MSAPSAAARFWLGFAAATSLWGALAAAAWWLGLVDRVAAPAPPPAVLAAVVDDAGAVEISRGRGRRGRRRGATARDDLAEGGGAASGGARASAPRGEATTGDSLDEGRPRELDLAGRGGERQLSSAQIEGAFDRAFPRIRRCLVLAAGDEPVTGRLVFGLRIRPTGEVAAVRLSGPAAVTTGEAGGCLRGAARAIRFPSFDGPEMVARYPMSLE